MYMEHMAILVDDPLAVAEWYSAHLGMKVVREGPPPTHMTFLMDAAGRSMVEIYAKDDLETPDYASMHHSLLHLAFFCEDVHADRQRLIDAGATAVMDVSQNDRGDDMSMVRDPWGLAIQLLRRVDPML